MESIFYERFIVTILVLLFFILVYIICFFVSKFDDNKMAIIKMSKECVETTRKQLDLMLSNYNKLKKMDVTKNMDFKKIKSGYLTLKLITERAEIQNNRVENIIKVGAGFFKEFLLIHSLKKLSKNLIEIEIIYSYTIELMGEIITIIENSGDASEEIEMLKEEFLE